MNLSNINKYHTGILQIICYGYVIIFFITDLIVDYIEDEIGWHYLLELIGVCCMIILLIYQIYTLYMTKKQLKTTTHHLSNLQIGLSHHIEEQLKSWQLSNAETEVCWLIIKGFTPKEIASTRSVTEKTVNKQLGNIYLKSHTKSRHELLSSLIEDIMVE